jgi:hypothetical protein
MELNLGCLGSPVNIYVEEGKVAVSFRLHDELNVLADTVQVVHVTEPAEGLMGSPGERNLVEVLHEEVCDTFSY